MSISSQAPMEARAKLEWDRDADLRSEFLGDFASYLPFKRAEAAGLVKTISGRVVGADRSAS